MPGDGITDVAPIAQLRQGALPPRSRQGDVRFLGEPFSQHGWMQPVTISAIQAQWPAVETGTRQQLVVAKGPQVDVRTHTAPFPNDGWLHSGVVVATTQAQGAAIATHTQHQLLVAKPPQLSFYAPPWYPEDGWLTPVTLPDRPAQIAGIQAQSEPRLLLATAPRLTIVHTAWQPQDGWVFPAPLDVVQIPQVAAMQTQMAQQGLRAMPPTFALLLASWFAQAGWSTQAVLTTPLQQNVAAFVLQQGAQLLLGTPSQLDARLLCAATPDPGWLSAFVLSLISPYATAMLAAVQAQGQQPGLDLRTGAAAGSPTTTARLALLPSFWDIAGVITPIQTLTIEPAPPPVILLPTWLPTGMALGDLVQRVTLKLGEQNLFYPFAEMIRGGLNPAQRLLCLVYPRLLQQRQALTLSPEQAFVDLRTISTRIRRIRRVLLGDMTADAPVLNATTGEYRDLTRTSIERLANQEGWFGQRGELKHYWLFGEYWLGVYKRPFDVFTLTVIFEATPTVLDANTLDQIPEVAAVWHPVLADIATGLLLIKEGEPQSTRGVQWILRALNRPNPHAGEGRV